MWTLPLTLHLICVDSPCIICAYILETEWWRVVSPKRGSSSVPFFTFEYGTLKIKRTIKYKKKRIINRRLHLYRYDTRTSISRPKAVVYVCVDTKINVWKRKSFTNWSLVITWCVPYFFCTFVVKVFSMSSYYAR